MGVAEQATSFSSHKTSPHHPMSPSSTTILLKKPCHTKKSPKPPTRSLSLPMRSWIWTRGHRRTLSRGCVPQTRQMQTRHQELTRVNQAVLLRPPKRHHPRRRTTTPRPPAPPRLPRSARLPAIVPSRMPRPEPPPATLHIPTPHALRIMR